jgi:hypothetical protein
MQALSRNRCAASVAPLDHAATSFSVFDQTFFEKVCVEPKPLRRFITPLFEVFAQAFFEKACVFDQTFFEKVCDQAVF